MIMTLTYHRGRSAHKSRQPAGVRAPFLFLILVRAINFTAEGFTCICLLSLDGKTRGHDRKAHLRNAIDSEQLLGRKIIAGLWGDPKTHSKECSIFH